jgi:purine-cytosine permease-like protein
MSKLQSLSALPFAQVDVGFTIAHWAEVAILIAAVVGILLVILAVFGVQIPSWVQKILWILLAAIVGIAAINLLMRMMY